MPRVPPKLNIPAGAGSLPLDPPPFFLDREIRLAHSFAGLAPVIVGLLIVSAYGLLFYNPGSSIEPFWRLMGVSVAAGSLYLVGRFLSYWAAWLWVTRLHSSVDGIHPTARGELPRNAFLAVLIVPGTLLLAACLLGTLTGQGFGPELWLAVAVLGGNVLGDLRAVWHLAFVESTCWVKQTQVGLDVLRPVGGSSRAALR